jgi:hypothetical protein
MSGLGLSGFSVPMTPGLPSLPCRAGNESTPTVIHINNQHEAESFLNFGTYEDHRTATHTHYHYFPQHPGARLSDARLRASINGKGAPPPPDFPEFPCHCHRPRSRSPANLHQPPEQRLLLIEQRLKELEGVLDECNDGGSHVVPVPGVSAGTGTNHVNPEDGLLTAGLPGVAGMEVTGSHVNPEDGILTAGLPGVAGMEVTGSRLDNSTSLSVDIPVM